MSVVQGLGVTGKVKFKEDCHSFDFYPHVPLTKHSPQQFWTHPVVCCFEHVQAIDRSLGKQKSPSTLTTGTTTTHFNF